MLDQLVLDQLKITISSYYEQNTQTPTQPLSSEIEAKVLALIELLDQGKIRVAEKQNSQWQINTWVKQAILLYFKMQKNQMMGLNEMIYYDKIPLKYSQYTDKDFVQDGVRIDLLLRL